MEISEKVRKLVKATKRPKEKFVPGKSFIPVAKAVYDDEEVTSLVQAALDFRMVDGEVSHLFEREMAKYLGVRLATFCNSGSSANLLAFMALTSPLLGSRSLKAGDEVITSAVGFPTTVAPILQAGCIPVYVDVSLGSYNPTSYQIADAVTEKTKAIFLAHTLGNPFDVEKIRDIAEANGLWLIEDCADALGGEFNGKKLGTFGSLSTTSFYPAHMITTGEGGMVFTDNPMLNQIVRSMRDWGRSCWCLPNKDNTCGKRFTQKNQGDLPDGYDHKYTYSHLGYNLKSTDLQASIGIEQLKKLPDFVARRRQNWNYLGIKFVKYGLEKFFILPTHYSNAQPAFFGFPLTVRASSGFTRSDIVQYLESRMIGTRNLFGGNITKQPAFKGKGRISDMLPKADIVMESTFWIGVHPGMDEHQCNYIVDTFLEFVDSRK